MVHLLVWSGMASIHYADNAGRSDRFGTIQHPVLVEPMQFPSYMTTQHDTYPNNLTSLRMRSIPSFRGRCWMSITEMDSLIPGPAGGPRSKHDALANWNNQERWPTYTAWCRSYWVDNERIICSACWRDPHLCWTIVNPYFATPAALPVPIICCRWSVYPDVSPCKWGKVR